MNMEDVTEGTVEVSVTKDEGFQLLCLICGQRKQCKQLLINGREDDSQELEVMTNFCKLLKLNFSDLQGELSFSDSYCCSECFQDLLLISRLEVELEEITRNLGVLKSTCLEKLNQVEEFMDDNDLIGSVQLMKRRKFCQYVRSKTCLPTSGIKQESEDDFFDPASVLELETLDGQSDGSNYSDEDAVAREYGNVHRIVKKPASGPGRIQTNSAKRKKAAQSKNFNRGTSYTDVKKKQVSRNSDRGSCSSMVKAAKDILGNGKTSRMDHSNRLENGSNSVEVVRPGRRKKQDFSELFKESSESSGSDSSSSSENESEIEILPGEELEELKEAKLAETIRNPQGVGVTETRSSAGSEMEFLVADSVIGTTPPLEVNPTKDEDSVKNDATDCPKFHLKDLYIRAYKLPDDDPRILASKQKWGIRILRLSRGVLRYKCPKKYCKHKFHGQTQCKIHFRKFHMKMKYAYECQECWTCFSSKEEYEEHENEEAVLKKQREEQLKAAKEALPLPPKPHICTECGKNFRKRKHLKKHMKIHDPDVFEPEPWELGLTKKKRGVSFRCTEDNCKARFMKEEYLQAHLLVHQGITRPFICKVCGKGYKEHSRLVDHENIHSNDKPYECKECNERFSAKKFLYYHMSTRHKPKSFQCDTCGFVFARHQALQAHQLVHTDAKPHTCEVCGKSFRLRSTLRGHLPEHPELNLQKNICSFCGKVFKHPRYLQDHERTHTGEGLYRCNLCDFTGPRPSDIQGHMISHSTDRNHECDLCQKKFKTALAVRKHKESSHASERNHVCEECGKAFFSRIRLGVHIYNCHKGHTYLCSLCPSKFTRKNNLTRHMIYTHPEEVPPKKPKLHDAAADAGTKSLASCSVPSQLQHPFISPQQTSGSTSIAEPESPPVFMSHTPRNLQTLANMSNSGDPSHAFMGGMHPTPGSNSFLHFPRFL